MRNIIAFLLLTITVLVPDIVYAKWSKASSKFSYGGIKVEVVDRHEEVVRMYDTYGYTIFKNSLDCKVDVKWKGYGILKHTHQLVLLSDGQFTLYPNQERKEVYSYGAGRFTEKNFESYVISINPTEIKSPKDSGTDTESETKSEKASNGKSENQATVNSQNADNVYERIMKASKEGTLSEKDYIEAVDWMDYMWTSKVESITTKLVEYYNQDKMDEIDKMGKKYSDISKKWEKMGVLLNKAYKNGLLPSKSKKKYENILREASACKDSLVRKK